MMGTTRTLLVALMLAFLATQSRAAVPITPGLKTFGTAIKGMSLTANETELYSRSGSGVVTLLWFTGELLWPTFGNTRIRIYVDGEPTSSIDFEILMAVGMTGPTLTPWGENKLGNVALSGGVYFTYRIPFYKSLRITAQLPAHMLVPGDKSFYFIVRGMATTSPSQYPVLLGDLQLPTNAKLVLHTLENYQGQPFEQILLYNTTGGGALLQTTMYAISSNLRYLEGEFSAVVDDEGLLLSSGTEDYFLSGQYFDLGTYHTPVSGCTLIDRFVNHTFAAYKLFEQDPVIWSDSFMLRWMVGHDHGKLAPKRTNVTSLVWAYSW